MKKIIFVALLGLLTSNAIGQIEIDDEGVTTIENRIKIFSPINSNRHHAGVLLKSHKGYSGESVNYIFNPNRGESRPGFIFQHDYDESSGFYTDEDYSVIWNPGDDGYLLKVIDEDNMNLKWYLDGNGNAFTNSDKRKKQNILPLASNTLGFTTTTILNSINKLKAVKYEFTETLEEIAKRKASNTKTQNNRYIGLLAQDLEQVFPEVVQTNEEGHKFVNYDGLIPVLIEGIKELTKKVEDLEKEVSELKTKQ